MLENNSVEYFDRDIFTPATVTDIAELKENSSHLKAIEDSFLLSYYQEDASFANDDIFDNDEDDEWNYLSKQEMNHLIDQYEQQFGMTSEQFIQLKKLGKAPDVFETMVWESLLEFC